MREIIPSTSRAQTTINSPIIKNFQEQDSAKKKVVSIVERGREVLLITYYLLLIAYYLLLMTLLEWL